MNAGRVYNPFVGRSPAAAAIAQSPKLADSPTLVGADMEHFSAMMANLMGVQPDIAPSGMKRMGIDMDKFGKQRNKTQIIKSHEEGLRATQMRLSDCSTIVSQSFNKYVKVASDFPTPPALDDCVPISVKELQQGTTHRGRVLRGYLVVDANYMGSVHTVLEDQAGDCVKVDSSPHWSPATWMLMPCGTSVFDHFGRLEALTMSP